ncbi:unnamed protein product [Staurois parvus]|uniref:Uncharacterized protein n=1 Tax=Staurois parvus TaxID=386267 RepID=A0ABN9GQA4_9NEOB|nr:unnamed protein product [Staurois parvus]
MGPRTASSCCCQAPNLPWAPVPPPHAAARSTVCHAILRPHIAAARPLICHGPLYRLSSRCCQVQVHSVSWVPVPPPIAAVSNATLCHVPLSGLLTLLLGSILS